MKAEWCPSHRNTLASMSNDEKIKIWHPHSMPSDRCGHTINVKETPIDISWQIMNNHSPYLASVDKKYTLRLYESVVKYNVSYVGRNFGKKIDFGTSHIMGINGYTINTFDVSLLKRKYSTIAKSGKYHKNLINHISLCQDKPNGLFTSIDEANTMVLWKFDGIFGNAININGDSIVQHCHNIFDKEIYSIANQSRMSQKKDNNLLNREIVKSYGTLEDEEKEENKEKEKEKYMQYMQNKNQNKQDKNLIGNGVAHGNQSDKHSVSVNVELKSEKNSVTGVEFIKHSPRYFVTTGIDGTIKLWDTHEWN